MSTEQILAPAENEEVLADVPTSMLTDEDAVNGASVRTTHTHTRVTRDQQHNCLCTSRPCCYSTIISTLFLEYSNSTAVGLAWLPGT